MDSPLEQIQAKIAELEGKLVNLKIAERELLALEKTSARNTRTLQPKPVKKTSKANAAKIQDAVSPEHDADAPHKTIGAAITEVLQQHGPISAKAIASAIQESGKDINNRAVSFGLQALKRRGLVKSVGGEWSIKGRVKRAG